LSAIDDLKRARDALDKDLKKSENRNKLQAADIGKIERNVSSS
jgi:hypothetical protein